MSLPTFRVGLYGLLVCSGWLGLAYVLALFTWTLLLSLAPLPESGASNFSSASPDILWIANLDDYWQPAEEQQVTEQVQPIERSRLRVDVQGVLFSSRPKASVVLVRYRNQAMTLAIGDSLEEGIMLEEIRPDALVFNRQGRLEKVDWQLGSPDRQVSKDRLLDQPTQMSSTSSARRPGRPNSSAESATSRESSSGEQSVTRQERVGTQPLEDTFGPNFREALVRDPLQLMRHVTVSPHNEGGNLQGFRVRPGSDSKLFDSLGLKAGDLVVAVNGSPVSDTSAMMQLHGDLASATALDVEILREGERLLFSLEME